MFDSIELILTNVLNLTAIIFLGTLKEQKLIACILSYINIVFFFFCFLLFLS